MTTENELEHIYNMAAALEGAAADMVAAKDPKADARHVARLATQLRCNILDAMAAS